MIKIDLNNLLIPESFLELKYGYKLNEVISWIKQKYKEKKLWFIDVDINNDVEKIINYVDAKKDFYEDIVVLGIWWSALWAKSILTAIKWKYYNNLSKKQRNWYLRLHILDNVDPMEISQLLEVIDISKTLFCVISKSGSTIETKSQYIFFKNKVIEKDLDCKKHFIVIAWENSDFKQDMMNSWLDVFDLADNIGWRFSALTNVGLLPLAFCWVDIKWLLGWVTKIKQDLLSEDLYKNTALLTSIIQYHSYIELWKNITVFFPYSANMCFFWAWYKQMIWESLGKAGTWVTLSDSIWVTDQHSQLQLYYDWPNDKLVIFLEVEDFWVDFKISTNQDISFSDLMYIEKYWTEQSLSSYNKINYTIKISDLKEESIWELVFFFEMQTAILWELYWFDAFDQPWVEIWKKITKEKLKQKFWTIDFL